METGADLVARGARWHAGTIWAGTLPGGESRSADRGGSWRFVESLWSRPNRAMPIPHGSCPRSPDQCRVPGDGALIVNRTRDGGTNFETLRNGLPQPGCYDLVYRHGPAVADDGRGLLMGSTTDGRWASFDGGDHWHGASLTLPTIDAMRFG